MPKARCWFQLRRHPRAVQRQHREQACRRSCAARARAGSPPNTACCRALPIPAATARPHAASRRAHPGNPASDRPLAARLCRSRRAGRTHHHPRLRRAAGRRRYPHRRHHRRVRRAGRCGAPGCRARKEIARNPIHGAIAAVSVGVYRGVPVLDLDYAEDSDCDTDMNVVMNDGGGFIEAPGHRRRPCLPSRRTGRACSNLAETGHHASWWPRSVRPWAE